MFYKIFGFRLDRGWGHVTPFKFWFSVQFSNAKIPVDSNWFRPTSEMLAFL